MRCNRFAACTILLCHPAKAARRARIPECNRVEPQSMRRESNPQTIPIQGIKLLPIRAYACKSGRWHTPSATSANQDRMPQGPEYPRGPYGYRHPLDSSQLHSTFRALTGIGVPVDRRGIEPHHQRNTRRDIAFAYGAIAIPCEYAARNTPCWTAVQRTHT